MKKRLAAGAVFLLVGSVQAAFAEERNIEAEEGVQAAQEQHALERDWAISGYIGMADFDSEEKPDPFRPGVHHEMESDAAGKFGLVLSKYYGDFSFNFGIEYILETTVEDEVGNELAEHSHIPVSLGVNYYFDTRLIDPYIGAGVGYSFNDTTESGFISRQGMRGEVDDSMFYFLTAGVEYPVREKYALFLAGQYSIGDADIQGTVETPQGSLQMENETTLDRYELNLGVKYFF